MMTSAARRAARTGALLLGVAAGGCALALHGPDSLHDLAGGREQVLAAATRQQALEYLPRRASMEWRASDGQSSGRITPTRTFRGYDGRYCREFDETVVAGSFTDTFRDIRCRTADGRWLMPDGPGP